MTSIYGEWREFLDLGEVDNEVVLSRKYDAHTVHERLGSWLAHYAEYIAEKINECPLDVLKNSIKSMQTMLGRYFFQFHLHHSVCNTDILSYEEAVQRSDISLAPTPDAYVNEMDSLMKNTKYGSWGLELWTVCLELMTELNIREKRFESAPPYSVEESRNELYKDIRRVVSLFDPEFETPTETLKKEVDLIFHRIGLLMRVYDTLPDKRGESEIHVLVHERCISMFFFVANYHFEHTTECFPATIRSCDETDIGCTQNKDATELLQSGADAYDPETYQSVRALNLLMIWTRFPFTIEMYIFDKLFRIEKDQYRNQCMIVLERSIAFSNALYHFEPDKHKFIDTDFNPDFDKWTYFWSGQGRRSFYSTAFDLLILGYIVQKNMGWAYFPDVFVVNLEECIRFWEKIKAFSTKVLPVFVFLTSYTAELVLHGTRIRGSPRKLIAIWIQQMNNKEGIPPTGPLEDMPWVFRSLFNFKSLKRDKLVVRVKLKKGLFDVTTRISPPTTDSSKETTPKKTRQDYEREQDDLDNWLSKMED